MKKSGISKSGKLLKNSKEFLRQSTEHYQSLFEFSMDAILLTGPDGSIYSANPAAGRMFGWSVEELCRLGRTGLVDNSDPRLNAGLLLRERNRSVSGELTMIRKNGEKFPAEISSSIFRDSAGNERTSMIIRDISERKTVEMTLHLQGEILKNITEGINLIRRSDETIVFTNPGFDRMFGYEPGELIGKDVSVINAAMDKSPEKIKRDIINTVNMTGEWQGEILNIKKNGDYFWCYANVTVFDHISYGKVCLSVHTDITLHKLSVEALKESELRFKQIAMNSASWIWEVDQTGLYTYTSQVVEEVLGFKPEELIGKKHFYDLFKPEDRKQLKKAAFSAFERKDTFRDFIKINVNKNGREVLLSTSGLPIIDSTGNLTGYRGVDIDITARIAAEKKLRKSEEDLRKSKKLLENLNRHQNEIRENERALISRIVHDELGQSMTALKLDLSMMHKYLSNDPEAVTKIDKMIALVSDAIKIVQRISSDLRPGILDDLGLIAAIEWYCDEFENRSGIKCSVELDSSDISDSRISLTFFRVLQECLTNVIRHSMSTHVNVVLRNSQKGTTLTIHDNGIGISKEKIDSYNSMGLINIRERVRQFNGKATILSKYGAGTKITVFIPSKQRFLQ